MYCNPTLTSQEFSKIHSAMIDISSITSKLEGVVDSKLLLKLVNAQLEMQEALKGAYEQDDKVFETKMDHFSSVQQDLGLDTTWSIYEIDNLNDRHPYEGAKQVVYKDYNSNKDIVVEINGSTYAALYVAANAAIIQADTHHNFIEHFQQSTISPEILFLSTGS